MKKVVTRIKGGLGNQMFIYAAARAISLKNGFELVLDIKNGYTNDIFKRTYLLNHFNLPFSEANRLSSFNFPGGDKFRGLSKRIQWILGSWIKYIAEDESHSLNKELIAASTTSLYIDGYWQSEIYFKDYSDIIRSDFKFPQFDDAITLREASDIENCNGTPISIGIRRYQEVPAGSNIIKITDYSFYEKAIKYIQKNVPDPVFFIFSEDHDWVNKYLPNDINKKIIERKIGDEKALNDMYLMSLCKHHIISNSSFYWWGAWLANNKNKIVVASDCFLNPLSIPDNWIKF